MFSFSSSTALLALISLVSGSFAQLSTSSTPSSKTSSLPHTHTVTVGKGTNAYDPDTIQASPGDVIVFQFFPSNHSIIKAEYGYPCVPYEDVVPNGAGFFSGHFPLSEIPPDPPTWNLTVNDTKPTFFYCSAPGSCIDFQMVGVINPNATTLLSRQKTLAKAADYMVDSGQPFPQEAESSISSMAATATATVTSVASEPSDTGPPPLTETSTHSGLSGGAIAGIVVGSVAVLLLAAALFFYVGRTKSLKQALAYKSNTEAARSSLPPPPPTKDMIYSPDHPFGATTPYHPDNVSHNRHTPSYDVPPYSVTPKTPEPTAEELDSAMGSPRMSPRSFGPGPRYMPGTESGSFYAGSSDPIPVVIASDRSTRSNTMLSEGTTAMTRSQRNSHVGPHEMDAS